MVAELGEWGEGRLIRKASGKAGHQLHILLQVETTRGTGSHVVVIHREMTIAVGIGTGWSDMRWVEDVGVNESELRSVSAMLNCGLKLRVMRDTHICLDAIEPFLMALLNVLAPKVFAFEEFSTLRHFAPELRFVLLLDELLELLI